MNPCCISVSAASHTAFSLCHSVLAAMLSQSAEFAHPTHPMSLQLYTQVEAFAAAISKLREMGFNVNTEESELVYRGTAGGLVCHKIA